jgi:hypothetical protein
MARVRPRRTRTLALLAALVAVVAAAVPASASAEDLPAVAVTTPGTVVDGVHATTDHRPTWTWTANVPAGVDDQDRYINAQCRIDSGAWALCSPIVAPAVSFRPTVLQALADGDHTVDVRWARFDANDASLLETGPATATQLRVDGTAPVLGVTVPADGDGAQRPDLAFTTADAGVGIDAATVGCRVYPVDATEPPAYVTPCTSPFASPALVRNTTYRFEVTAKDKLGTAATTSHDWVVQNTTPTAPAVPDVAVHSGDDVEIELPAADADGDALVFTVTAPTRGTLDTSDLQHGSVVYHAPADVKGEVTFDYTVKDGREQGTANGTVTIDVTNARPVAADVPDATVHSGAAVTIPLPATDADGDTLTYSVTDPKDGAAAVTGSLDKAHLQDGSVVYTAPGTFAGEVTFDFSVDDGHPDGTDTATVTIDVTNETPETEPLDLTVHAGDTIPVAPVATDGDDDALTFTTTTPIAVDASGDPILDEHDAVIPVGTLTEVSAGHAATTYSYAAPKTYTGLVGFDYTVDDHHPAGTSTSRVTIEITNTTPVAQPLTGPSVESGDDIPLVLSADDADGDALVWEAHDPIAVDASGDPILDGDGHEVRVGTLDRTHLQDGEVTFAAPASYSGYVGFGYTVDDQRPHGTASADVLVAVTPQTELTTLPVADDNPVHSTNDTTPTWAFDSPVAGVAFECRLTKHGEIDPDDPDAGPGPDDVLVDWEACGSGDPHAFTADELDDGTYTFAVRAVHDTGSGTLTDPTPASSTIVVDTDLPVVTIDEQPAALNNTARPEVAFSATDDTASFTCVVTYEDNEGGVPVEGDATACGTDGSGRWAAAADLADGTYTVAVTPKDPAGNVGVTESATWETDRTKPVLTQESGLEDGGYTSYTAAGGTIKPEWTFSYSDRNVGANVPQCVIYDIGQLAPAASDCDANGVSGAAEFVSPTHDLREGGHALRVSVADDAGNVTELPVDFTVDTLFPTAKVATAAAVTGADVTFHIGSDDPDATFSCTLTKQGSTDPVGTFGLGVGTAAGDFAPCDAVLALTGLDEGRYTLRVKATDKAGNTQGSGWFASVNPKYDTVTWDVRTALPTVSITSGPDLTTTKTYATFVLAGSDADADLDCKVDDADTWTGCSSSEPFHVTGLAVGEHTFSVRARDPETNAPGPVATYAWTIGTPTAGQTGGGTEPTVTGGDDPPGGGATTADVPAPAGGTVTPSGETAPTPAAESCPVLATKSAATKTVAVASGLGLRVRLSANQVRLGGTVSVGALLSGKNAKSAFGKRVKSIVLTSGGKTVATLKGPKWAAQVKPSKAGTLKLSVAVNRKQGKSIKTALTLKVVERCA